MHVLIVYFHVGIFWTTQKVFFYFMLGCLLHPECLTQNIVFVSHLTHVKGLVNTYSLVSCSGHPIFVGVDGFHLCRECSQHILHLDKCIRQSLWSSTHCGFSLKNKQTRDTKEHFIENDMKKKQFYLMSFFVLPKKESRAIVFYWGAYYTRRMPKNLLIKTSCEPQKQERFQQSE